MKELVLLISNIDYRILPMNKILIEHGGGGDKSSGLIKDIFLKNFSNEILNRLEDASPLDIKGNCAVSTDSFTVKPFFFKGGDIGKLAISGTCNDLAVMGARPKYITCSFIIEEGFLIHDLEKIVKSMNTELKINDASIITGDTKVMPRGTLDGIIINTTGIGLIEIDGISAGGVKDGDALIISHNIGDHGAHIFISREGMGIESELKSDCASLWPLIEKLSKEDLSIRAVRDVTRGGLSAVLHEWSRQSHISIHLKESKIPIDKNVRGICELLGFEPYHLACEGTFLLAVPEKNSNKTLDIIKKHPLGKDAAKIGYAFTREKKKDSEFSDLYSDFPEVILETSLGTKRKLDTPPDAIFPRIC
jgi:hydrogenase expression/formation protein HypE